MRRFQFVLLLLVASAANAYEEPEYEVLQETNDFEIRAYAGYLVAKTRVNGDFDRSSGSAAFQCLAGCIFDDNRRVTPIDQ